MSKKPKRYYWAVELIGGPLDGKVNRWKVKPPMTLRLPFNVRHEVTVPSGAKFQCINLRVLVYTFAGRGRTPKALRYELLQTEEGQ